MLWRPHASSVVGCSDFARGRPSKKGKKSRLAHRRHYSSASSCSSSDGAYRRGKRHRGSDPSELTGLIQAFQSISASPAILRPPARCERRPGSARWPRLCFAHTGPQHGSAHWLDDLKGKGTYHTRLAVFSASLSALGLLSPRQLHIRCTVALCNNAPQGVSGSSPKSAHSLYSVA